MVGGAAHGKPWFGGKERAVEAALLSYGWPVDVDQTALPLWPSGPPPT